MLVVNLLSSSTMLTVALEGLIGTRPGSTKVSLTFKDSVDSIITSSFTVTVVYIFDPPLSPFLNIKSEPAMLEKSPGETAVSLSVENLFKNKTVQLDKIIDKPLD